MGLSIVVPRMTVMASFCTPLSFSRLDCLWQGCETQSIVSDAEYHTQIQQEQMTLFNTFWSHGFLRGQSFLAPEFCWFNLCLVCQHSVEVDLEVSETVRSTTSSLKETAGIACPTALLLRVHHWACSLLGLISDSVSWHQCDTFVIIW